jgi:sporulation protein YqfC
MAVRKKNTVSRKIADILDLPRDVILDLPKISALGNSQITVENHRGIIEYRPDLMRISTSRGEIRIIGANLTIGTILRDEIVVEGRLMSFEYVDWGLA